MKQSFRLEPITVAVDFQSTMISTILLMTALVPSVLGYDFMYEFHDSSRESFSIGDDVTLTCPITLCDGEEYETVEWIYWSCGKYYFKNGCNLWTRWRRTTSAGERNKSVAIGMTMYVPSDASQKTTLTISNITCDRAAFYHCKVVGTNGTQGEHRIDVNLFTDAAVLPTLTPEPIISGQSGPIQFTCVDRAHTPGSSMRMYYGEWGWFVTVHEVNTTCSTVYLPKACYEVNTCTGTMEKRAFQIRRTFIQCDITRPGGKRVYTRKNVQVIRPTV